MNTFCQNIEKIKIGYQIDVYLLKEGADLYLFFDRADNFVVGSTRHPNYCPF